MTSSTPRKTSARKTTTAKAAMVPDKAPATGHIVGDTITVDPAAALVRLPDGTVVSCRGSYVPTLPGDYVFFVTEQTDDGPRVHETEVTVAEKDPS